jgi:hypothetical protein
MLACTSLLLLRAAAAPAAAPATLTYMASFDTFSVWEDLSKRDGALSFYTADNATLVLTLAKRDVDAAQLVPTANQSCCGYGYKIEQLTSVAPDLLGRAVLDEAASTGDDPDEAKVRKTPSWPSATRAQKLGQLQSL